MLEVALGDSRIRLVRGDITALGRHVGAIVNAADPSLRPFGGVSGAIHDAGGPEIAVECLWIGEVERGKVVVTTAGKLDADMVLHAVEPLWQGGARDEDRTLATTYRTCLTLAAERGAASIAFPPISTGIYAYPIDRAAAIAIGTSAVYLKQGGTLREIMFVQSTEEDHASYQTALGRWHRRELQRVIPPRPHS
jgi:O-acetyl-ADP-ribose deacetylase (regulator of RNase III)